MPSLPLLDLPREIRDMIIDQVLLDRDPVTATNSQPQAYPAAWFTSTKSRGICYVRDEHRPSRQNYTILRVNRQLRSEARQRLKKLVQHTYRIDVLIERQGLWVPYMPLRPSTIIFKSVDAHVHVVNDDAWSWLYDDR